MKNGDMYWYIILSFGTALVRQGIYGNGYIDSAYRDAGNFFDSRDAAWKAAMRINAIFGEGRE